MKSILITLSVCFFSLALFLVMIYLIMTNFDLESMIKLKYASHSASAMIFGVFWLVVLNVVCWEILTKKDKDTDKQAVEPIIEVNNEPTNP